MTSVEQKARLGDGLTEPGESVLCAVSGGADSMALLHWLWQREKDGGLRVCAAHYEHGLRGGESLRDADFVAAWCAERGIPCRVEHGDASAYAAERALGVEEAARELRYAFLARTAAALGCQWIATAHTADDNAETVLLNLCRGAGAAGLAGIPPRRGNILRPLLDCTRAEVEDYLRTYGVPHVEDSSNQSDAYRRNLLRHRVMPVLQACNGAVSEAIRRMSETLRQDEDCLAQQAETFIQIWYKDGSLPVEELNRLHPAIAARVLRRLCQSPLDQRHIRSVLEECARPETHRRVQLQLPGHRLERANGRLYVAARPEEAAASIPDRPIEPGQTVEIPEAALRIRAELGEMDEEVYDLFKTLNFKYENICGKLFCTGRRPGDRLHPLGRGCGKGLKALFQEAGLDPWKRSCIPLFRDEKGPLAIYGLVLDERAAAKPGDRVLRLHVEHLQTEGEKE